MGAISSATDALPCRLDGLALLGEPLIELAPRPDGTYALGFSGDVLNVAIHLGRFGFHPGLVTAVGDDSFSRQLLAQLAAQSIATLAVHRCPQSQLGLYLIERDAALRRSHYWRSGSAAARFLGSADLGEALRRLPLLQPLYVSGITLALLGTAGLDAVLAESARGRSILFDTNLRPALWQSLDDARHAFTRLLPGAAFVSASHEDIGHLWGLQAEDALLARTSPAAEVVVRRADHAIGIAFRGRHWTFAPPPPRPVADPTGAGDAFNAAYLAVRACGRDPVQAVTAARGYAELVIARCGAIPPPELTPSLEGLLA